MKAIYTCQGSEIQYYPQTEAVISDSELPVNALLISAVKFMYANQLSKLAIGDDAMQLEFVGIKETLSNLPGRTFQPLTALSVTCEFDGVVNVSSEEFYYGNIKNMYQGGDGVALQTGCQDLELNKAIERMCNSISDAVYAFKAQEATLLNKDSVKVSSKRKNVSIF